MADNDDTPISPIVERKPELTITAPTVNSEPAELDGTPTSPENVRGIKRGVKHDERSPEEQSRREKLMTDRQDDKGVLVDVPGTPSAEEFTKSQAGGTEESEKA